LRLPKYIFLGGEKDMKKIIVCLFVFLAAVSLYAADPIQLGNFAIGQWKDPNYNAIWDFSGNNIRILSTDGKVLYDFSDKTILNFSVFLEGTDAGISFTCPEAGRSYRFVKPLTNTDLIMVIDRAGRATYSVAMKKY
jgi:hypothetical protein